MKNVWELIVWKSGDFIEDMEILYGYFVRDIEILYKDFI